MKAKYEHLFYIYQKLCEKHKNPETEQQLKYGIRLANSLRNELCGMTVLMHEMDVLNPAELEHEQKKIRETFSTMALFGASEMDGEICGLKGKGGMNRCNTMSAHTAAQIWIRVKDATAGKMKRKKKTGR